jgi:hypothetical protein
MRLPLAIHAARQGYAWLNQSQHNFSLLERFRKAIGKMPDIDCGEPLSCGALNVAEWVVVYRFMIEKGGDFLGRDCLCLTLTYFDRSVSSSVNIARLLEQPYFREPMREPPESFEYMEGASQACPFNPANPTSEELASLGFAMAGAAFQHPFDGVLRLMQADGFPCRVNYQREMPMLRSSEQAREKVHSPIADECALERAPQRKWTRMLVWSAAAASLLLIAGILDWRNGSTGISLDCFIESEPMVSRKGVLRVPLEPDSLCQVLICTNAYPMQKTFFYVPGLLDLPFENFLPQGTHRTQRKRQERLCDL